VRDSAQAFSMSSGNRATLVAIRRASSFVSTFACRASASLSREYRYASACPLASWTNIATRHRVGVPGGSGSGVEVLP
jgi:hypothetical protein